MFLFQTTCFQGNTGAFHACGFCVNHEQHTTTVQWPLLELMDSSTETVELILRNQQAVIDALQRDLKHFVVIQTSLIFLVVIQLGFICFIMVWHFPVGR